MEKDKKQIRNERPLDEAGDASLSDLFAERRAVLARIYRSLPPYGSVAFWELLERTQEKDQALPLEVLVRVLREEALARADKQAQHRICEIIVARLQTSNEQWVRQALANAHLLPGERHMFAADLCADLCEQLLRALLDDGQRFWEESFQQALRFARKHVYEGFMRREGRWQKLTPGRGYRVPRVLLESLERSEQRAGSPDEQDVPDERAEQALLAVEQSDIAALLFRLPERLRAVVWLIFWEDLSTKAVGKLLNISDRTVRNRLQTALARLRQVLENEQEVVIDGKGA